MVYVSEVGYYLCQLPKWVRLFNLHVSVNPFLCKSTIMFPYVFNHNLSVKTTFLSILTKALDWWMIMWNKILVWFWRFSMCFLKIEREQILSRFGHFVLLPLVQAKFIFSFFAAKMSHHKMVTVEVVTV